MELLIGNMSMTQTGAAAGKASTASGKTEGQGAFGLLLQAAGLTAQTGETEAGTTDQEGLLAALAALAGGLSPLLLSNLQQPEITAEGTEQGLTLTVQAGEGTLSLLLKDLPLNNSELAAVLQEFGASPEILTVLFNQPKGNPVETLKSHPHLLPELGNALTQMVQSLTAQPQLLSQQTHTAVLFQTLMQSVQVERVQEDAATGEDTGKTDLAVPVKANSLLGKLQASISMHTLQTALQAVQADVMTEADGKATGTATAAATSLPGAQAEELTAAVKSAPDAQPKQAEGQPAAGVTANAAHLQLPERTLKLEPVVTMRADQFRSEFSEAVVKRATLIEAPGRHEFRIILEPQGLGEVEVRIQSVNKQISVQLIADSQASKGMLDSALAGLKLQLQAQGIQYDRIEVQTSSGNNTELGSGLQEHRGSGQQAREQQQGGQSRQAAVDTFTLSEGEALTDDSLLTPDSIDVTA